jgi:hypothetical protein
MGIRPTLILTTFGMLAGVLIALLSPLRTLQTLPEGHAEATAGPMVTA